MSTEISNFARLQELLPELFQASDLGGRSYLRSQLTSRISVLFPMDLIQESLLVSEEQITCIPRMPDYYVGLISSRDHVFSLIDLPQLLGLDQETKSFKRAYHTIVIRLNQEKETLCGFTLEKVQGIVRLDSEQIPVPSTDTDIPANLQPYLSGCIMSQDQAVPILNIASILQKIIQSS